jgi:hypothetical protein
MIKMSAPDCDRAAMGHASREIIGRWSPELFATNLLKAGEKACAKGRGRGAFLDRALLMMLVYSSGF